MPNLSRSLIATAVAFSFLAASALAAAPTILISVPDQKLVLVQDGAHLAQYPVSTSKFGVSDRPRSYGTPLGWMEVAAKIGDHAPEGAVFKGRRPTGEVLCRNARGRDPIVTRIMHLRGLEARNARAYDRGIYIHGTPEERRIGKPASYGCIRMRSRDIVRLFDSVPVGTRIEVLDEPMSRIFAELAAN